MRDASEDEFQAFIVDLARLQGWKVYFTPDWVYRLILSDMKRRRREREWPDKGFPDLVLVRPPQLLMVEVKSSTGKVRPPQREWLNDLRACGIDARLWRPRHEDEIVAVLSGLDAGREVEAA